MSRPHVRRSVVAANVITIMSFLLSCSAFYAFFRGDLARSIGMALLAFILDTLDGWVARTWHGESTFGKRFDAANDVVLYLMFPAAVLYQGFHLDQPISVVLLAVFVASGVYRLIRFSRDGIVRTRSGQLVYSGMPVVFSLLVLVVCWFMARMEERWFIVVADLMLAVMSVFMVSNIPFKKPRQPWVVGVVLLGAASYFLLVTHAH